MDMEALVLGLMNARLIEKTLSHEAVAERESVFMEDSTRRAFDSRMKGDACVSRQAARNMLDAQAMVDVAQTATAAIKKQLQGIVDTLEGSDEEFPDKPGKITAYLTEILRLAENTEFNGMKLMNGSAGTNGTVEIQAGNSEKELSFMNLLDTHLTDSVLGESSMNLGNLFTVIFDNDDDTENVTIKGTALASVERILGAVSTLDRRYAYESGSLGNLAQMFE
ncbi:MAG: hypothetical protein K6F46_05085, partial [Desulfovibrio sp.]|nr:hypothetical protein [Desulfovibrio sp.]